MQGDGDGWAAGPDGTRRWGIFGASGLFLVAKTSEGPKALLQLRAEWTAEGGTWGLPGGARDSHETPCEAALREAQEETGVDPSAIVVHEELVTSGPVSADPQRPELPGGWTYTTVVASAPYELATTANEESVELCWVPFEQIDSLPLLSALADNLGDLIAAWERREA